MKEWQFTNGLTGESVEDSTYQFLMEHALKSRPTPGQSGYKVHAAARTQSGKIVAGSNHEYGSTQAIHAEESAINAALEQAREDDPILHLALVAGEPGNIATPCGNCRDVIKQYVSLEEALLLSGSPEGGAATVMPMGAYFFDDFDESPTERKINSKAIEAARRAEQISHAIYSKPEGVYAAAIISADNAIFPGGLEGDVAYHPTFSIRNAITNLLYGSNDPSRLEVEELLILSTGHKPEIRYRDRQHFLEFADRVAAVTGNDDPIPITIVQMKEDGTIDRAWYTDSKEWLPHAFSPRNLGLEDTLRKSMQSLREPTSA